MSTALEILKKLQKVDLVLSAGVAMEETAHDYTDQQRKQLQQGLKSDNSYLPDYSFRSVFQYNKPPGPIRLYDTGDFYRGFLIDVRGDIFITESSDSKSKMLQDRYGEEILGLGTDARIEYIKSLKPVFIKQVKSYLQ